MGRVPVVLGPPVSPFRDAEARRAYQRDYYLSRTTAKRRDPDEMPYWLRPRDPRKGDWRSLSVKIPTALAVRFDAARGDLTISAALTAAITAWIAAQEGTPDADDRR